MNGSNWELESIFSFSSGLYVILYRSVMLEISATKTRNAYII